MRAIVLLAAVAAVLAVPTTKIESRLQETLATKGTANVLVTMKESTDGVLATFKHATFSTHGARTTAVAEALMKHAAQSQKSVLSTLDSQKSAVDYEVFWISNQIYIRNANAELVAQIAENPAVQDITQEFEVFLDPVIPGTPAPRDAEILAEWGVETVQAPACWSAGVNGAGAIVGGIDTGVLATHRDLSASYVGTNYGWRDTVGNSGTARDGNGHGTHTMGTIVGANGIGVAPGAKWMACKGLSDTGSGTNAGLISCGQFMACPTLPNGQSPDCSRAPHVVSNSWGGGQNNAFYNTVINSWKTAGIIPVFANGNSGPACTTANSPADSTVGVIAVGATTNTNGIASFSSKGPTSSGGRQSPDISAPGQNIRSAWYTSTSAYNTISGTSMATPHVAGVVAMLKSRNPNMSYAAVKSALEGSTSKNVVSSGRNCGGIAETNFPNMAFGHGILNAKNALGV